MAASGAADPNVDPFASIGGGVYVNGGWVPKGHPAAQAAGAQPAATAAASTPTTTTTGTVPGQAANASTYSTTPGAAPQQNTTNQGTQDVVRNSYLQQATQGTNVDLNDPNLKQQIDPYAASVERQKREYLNQQAEQMSAKGLGSSGALQNEQRLAAEHAGQQVGSFESELVGRELQNRRQEIQDALSNLSGLIDNDQKLALQKQLAELDAAIKREGIQTEASTAGSELGLKRELGVGGLNVDLIKALLGNQQFDNDLGYRISNSDWDHLLRSMGF